MKWPASTRESWSKNLHHDLGTKVTKRIDVTSPRNPADKGKEEPRWVFSGFLTAEPGNRQKPV